MIYAYVAQVLLWPNGRYFLDTLSNIHKRSFVFNAPNKLMPLSVRKRCLLSKFGVSNLYSRDFNKNPQEMAGNTFGRNVLTQGQWTT